jgi:hypothetical protein
MVIAEPIDMSIVARRGVAAQGNLLRGPRKITPQHAKTLARSEGIDILKWDHKGAL